MTTEEIIKQVFEKYSKPCLGFDLDKNPTQEINLISFPRFQKAVRELLEKNNDTNMKRMVVEIKYNADGTCSTECKYKLWKRCFYSKKGGIIRSQSCINAEKHYKNLLSIKSILIGE